MTGGRLVVRPGPGETLGDLCATLTELAGGRLPRAGHGGFVVDDDLGRAYLHAGGPELPVDPDPEPDPEPDPGPAVEPFSSTTTPPGGAPAAGDRPARPRRVPARRATMKGSDHDAE